MKGMKGQEIMTNVILAAVLLIIVGAAITYIIKEKKKGAACIGCSCAGTCAGKKSQDSQCSCH